MWDTLTIEQYQHLYPIVTDEKATPEDRDTRIISVLTGLTEAQIDHKPLSWFKEEVKKIQFLHSAEITGQAQTFIKGTKRKYRVNYDIAKMPFARYAEIKAFVSQEGNVIEKLHTILASVCTPMKRKWGFWVNDTFNAEIHEEYAEDLRGAKFADAYHTLVFFYHLFAASIKSLRGYMAAEIARETDQKTAIGIVDHLERSLDGFITQNRLPSMRGYQLRRLGRLLRYTH